MDNNNLPNDKPRFESILNYWTCRRTLCFAILTFILTIILGVLSIVSLSRSISLYRVDVIAISIIGIIVAIVLLPTNIIWLKNSIKAYKDSRQRLIITWFAILALIEKIRFI